MKKKVIEFVWVIVYVVAQSGLDLLMWKHHTFQIPFALISVVVFLGWWATLNYLDNKEKL